MGGRDDGTTVRDDGDPVASPDSGGTTPLVGSATQPTVLALVLSVAAVLVVAAVVVVEVVVLALVLVLPVAVALLVAVLLVAVVSAPRTGLGAPGAEALGPMTST